MRARVDRCDRPSHTSKVRIGQDRQRAVSGTVATTAR